MGSIIIDAKRMIAALCALLVLNGCSTSKGYLLVHDASSWVEQIREELPAGQRVKLALVDGGRLQGTVRAAEADSLRIFVWVSVNRRGTEVVVPYGRIAGVEALDFSFSKTVFMTFTASLGSLVLLLMLFPPRIS